MKDKLIIPVVFLAMVGYIIYLIVDKHERKIENKREYQIEVFKNGTYVYSNEEFIGFLPFTGSSLDSLILKDNQ